VVTGVALAILVTATPAAADETQALVLYRSGSSGGVSFEVRYLPTQNPARSGGRVDLQSVRLRTDLRSITLSNAILVRDGDSNLVDTWELITGLTLSDKGITASFEGTAFLVNADFEGPWDGALRSDTRSKARLALRLSSAGTSLWLKSSPVAGPFNTSGFASSKAFELRHTPQPSSKSLTLSRPYKRSRRTSLNRQVHRSHKSSDLWLLSLRAPFSAKKKAHRAECSVCLSPIHPRANSLGGSRAATSLYLRSHWCTRSNTRSVLSWRSKARFSTFFACQPWC
jgi:hypothetical protein